MKRFIVTGGYGFIGSNLVDKLIEGGHEVIIFHLIDEKEFSFEFNESTKFVDLEYLKYTLLIKQK